MAKRKSKKYTRQSTKHTYKTKDRKTRTPPTTFFQSRTAKDILIGKNILLIFPFFFIQISYQ
jgi:hypothetical protein